MGWIALCVVSLAMSARACLSPPPAPRSPSSPSPMARTVARLDLVVAFLLLAAGGPQVDSEAHVGRVELVDAAGEVGNARAQLAGGGVAEQLSTLLTNRVELLFELAHLGDEGGEGGV